jgi:hypothetical protein
LLVNQSELNKERDHLSHIGLKRISNTRESSRMEKLLNNNETLSSYYSYLDMHRLQKMDPISEHCDKTYNIFRNSCKKLKRDAKKHRDLEINKIEWKEVAKRVEWGFMIISLASILITPVLLFGKFFLWKQKENENCFCS